MFSYFFFTSETEPLDPCHPSPCGPNAACENGVCTCLPEYHGDPYIGCKPECVLNSDCPRDKACIKNKCHNPCVDTCGTDALCEVINHIPMCSCPPGTTGSPMYYCTKVIGMLSTFYIVLHMCTSQKCRCILTAV